LEKHLTRLGIVSDTFPPKYQGQNKKTGVYDCSQIRKFINDLAFPTPVNEKEFSVWNTLWKLSKTFGEIEKCPTTMRL